MTLKSLGDSRGSSNAADVVTVTRSILNNLKKAEGQYK